MKLDYDIKAFNNAATWRTWLSKNHKPVDGVWLKIHKKAPAYEQLAMLKL